MDLWGDTRTRVCARHALITPDSHIPSSLESWKACVPYYLITPDMGANLSQILGVFEKGGEAYIYPDECEQFVFAHEGEVQVETEDDIYDIKKDNYIFLPPFSSAIIRSGSKGAKLTIFEKIYDFPDSLVLDNDNRDEVDNLLNLEQSKEKFSNSASADSLVPTEFLPPLHHGNINDVKGEPFMGQKGAILRILLPENDFRYDMAVNFFRYDPGATLPLVETHIMEHGLIMTEGQGVYRLEESYYPVKEGDAIWMAPHCPQWFVAMGETNASYLYYKNVNRKP